MGWKIKNFNIFAVQRKIWFLGGFTKKPKYKEICLKKGGLDSVDLRGVWQESWGGVFEWEGVHTPMHTMEDSGLLCWKLKTLG